MDRDKSKNSDSSSDEDLRGMTPIPPNVLISPVILLTKEEMAQQRALKRSAKLERRSSGSFMTIESDSGIVLERDYEKPIVSQLPTVKESPSNSQESDSDSIKNKSGQVSIIEELTSRSQQSEAVKDESGQVSTIEELPSKSQQSEAVKDKSGQVSTIEELSSKSQRSEAAKDKSGQVPTVEKLPLKIQESDSIKTKTEKALVTGSAQSKPRQEGSEPKSRQSKDYNEKVPVASSSTLNAPISPSLSPYSPRISEKISPSTSERKPSPAQQVQKVVMSKKRKLEEIEQMHSGFLSFARKRSDRVRKKLQCKPPMLTAAQAKESAIRELTTIPTIGLSDIVIEIRAKSAKRRRLTTTAQHPSSHQPLAAGVKPPSSSSSEIGNLSKPPDTQKQSDPKPRQITQPIRSFDEFKKKVYPHARGSVLVPLATYDVPTGVKPYVLPEEDEITKTIESMNAKIDVKGKGKAKAY